MKANLRFKSITKPKSLVTYASKYYKTTFNKLNTVTDKFFVCGSKITSENRWFGVPYFWKKNLFFEAWKAFLGQNHHANLKKVKSDSTHDLVIKNLTVFYWNLQFLA